MTRIVVAGALANRPRNGGGAAVRMTWVEGLRRLGFDVWFVEQLSRDRLSPAPGAPPEEPLRFFLDVTRAHGLAERCALLDERGGRLAGVDRAVIDDVASSAALLVNLGGHLELPGLVGRFRRKAYVDLDPGYTQYWQESGLEAPGLAGHDSYFTVGLNVGKPGCAVPACGIAWRGLPPPVVLEQWTAPPAGLRAFTTVASWRGTFGRVERDGRAFGLKAHEFRRFLALPAHAPAALEIALAIHPADGGDLAALRQHGWRIVDPRAVAADPASYRRYILGSGAEFSVAQGIYVETGSGWLSDRTVRYLAAGRPAVVQDTGLADHLPLGRGLLVFRTLEEAIDALSRVAADYRSHCTWARELAAAHFDSDAVLGRFLSAATAAPGNAA